MKEKYKEHMDLGMDTPQDQTDEGVETTSEESPIDEVVKPTDKVPSVSPLELFWALASGARVKWAGDLHGLESKGVHEVLAEELGEELDETVCGSEPYRDFLKERLGRLSGEHGNPLEKPGDLGI